ncbi:cytochrome d ubiquinol oxidase subunit II [Luteolibacter algae]|uniref:Cytochrome d ubiquinol oxidase subunit II n=1 Tax=Luteolibacter algae TaxID=454151 RepID=A0ABW5D877_9BACT
MISVLIFFIAASLLLYILLGGSDFGAGILELLPGKGFRGKQKVVVNRAMGPVWEANHMWLILIVVILFMGFPTIFTTLMISLHLPMLALLVGVVVRGTVFTFRHYDAIQAPVSQSTYTLLFGLSSLWTSIWLGIIAASLTRGTIDPAATDPWAAYVAPWWGWYPLSLGIFVACIFAFLASVFLVGETDEPALKQHFRGRAAAFNVAVIVSGGLVFLASSGEKSALVHLFIRHPAAIAAMILATGLFVALWRFVSRSQVMLTRIIASGQVVLILFGWWVLYAPNAVITASGPLSFYDTAAPPATLRQLLIALLVGSLFIFPSLIFLLRVFKTDRGKSGFTDP